MRRFFDSRRSIAVIMAMSAILALRPTLKDTGPPPGLFTALAFVWAASLLLTVRALYIWCTEPSRRKPLLLFPLVLVTFLAFVREGFVPGLTFDMLYCTTERQVVSDAIVHRDDSNTGTPSVRLRELDPILEPVEADPPGSAVALGFQKVFVTRYPPSGKPTVTIHVKLHARDAACYWPLYKKASVPFQADVSMRWNSGGLKGTGSIKLTGTITQTVRGSCSARAFNQAVGADIEHEVTRQLIAFLTA